MELALAVGRARAGAKDHLNRLRGASDPVDFQAVRSPAWAAT
jgi:hypothetical protein